MTTDTSYSLAQLAQILSALENERRNPNSKRNAIKAIERNAAQIGLSAEDVFDAADDLLSGRLSAAQFRAALRDDGCGPASSTTEAAEPQPDDAADEPAEAYIMPNAGPLAVAESDAGGTGDDGRDRHIADSPAGAPEAATDAAAANPENGRSGHRRGASPPPRQTRPDVRSAVASDRSGWGRRPPAAPRPKRPLPARTPQRQSLASPRCRTAAARGG